MKKITTLSLALLLTVLTFLNAQTIDRNFQDGKVLFEFKEDAIVRMPTNEKGIVNLEAPTFLTPLIQKYKITKVIHKHPKHPYPLNAIYEVQFSKINEVEEMLRDLAAFSFMRVVEKKPLFYTSFTPNDQYHSTTNMWHLFKIKANLAWDISKGLSTIKVAVVDGAMLTTHPDMVGKFTGGYDVSDEDSDPNPPANSSDWDHGMHTSGIVGAATNNGIGVSSIGYNIKVIPIKATSNTTNNPSALDAGFEGVIEAADQGADVISLSWGGPSAGTLGQQYIDYAYNGKGCIVVAAAGNSGVTTKNYPAACNNVIAVASSDNTDKLSSFSNRGNWIDVMAPGEGIFSTITNHTGGNSGITYYDFLDGTSMACPLVAGLCGLIKSVNPSMTNTQIEDCLKNNCDNVNAANPGNTANIGAGRVNAQKSLQCAQATLPQAPVANFTVDNTSITAGGSVNFTDLSTNTPTTWAWTFTGANTTSSTSQNPTGIIYNTPGCYQVTLTASNAGGSDGETKSCYINVAAANAAPVADFIANKTTIAVGESVDFTDLSTNIPTGWFWNFTGASPSSSTSQNPTGIGYSAAGCYEVLLTASNTTGSDTKTVSCYITVNNPGITYCDTLANIDGNDTLIAYGISPTGGNWGFVSGTNSYGDKAKAEYFAAAPPTNYKVTGAAILFTKAYAATANSSVDIKLWNNANNKPNTELASKTIKINTINVNSLTYINFDNPVNVTGAYYIGVKLSTGTTNIDTVVVATNKNGNSNPGTAWEEWSNNTWSSYQSSWNIKVSNAILPIICKVSPAGITEADAIEAPTVFPNPSKGELSINFNSLDVKLVNIYNAMGEVVYTNSNKFSNNLLQLNLKNLANGIYYIETTILEQKKYSKFSIAH